MTQTEKQIEKIRTEIETLAGSTTALDDLINELIEAAERSGAEDVAIDLRDAGELTESAEGWLRENNGITVR